MDMDAYARTYSLDLAFLIMEIMPESPETLSVSQVKALVLQATGIHPGELSSFQQQNLHKRILRTMKRLAHSSRLSMKEHISDIKTRYYKFSRNDFQSSYYEAGYQDDPEQTAGSPGNG